MTAAVAGWRGESERRTYGGGAGGANEGHPPVRPDDIPRWGRGDGLWSIRAVWGGKVGQGWAPNRRSFSQCFNVKSNPVKPGQSSSVRPGRRNRMGGFVDGWMEASACFR
jgi:hypothetical protein